jgi:lipoate-protein ligase B
MAGKKNKEVAETAEAVEVEPVVTAGEGKEVESELAIPEVPSIKVRCPKRGVRLMTPSEYAEYSKERDAKK